uniref:Uncharacterized protein n=1 Tax=uncultured marine virus TaxID=186617 RepID=A0A0F7L5I5_9VIRU|nr:hypothetical protein [uncultured marine virus]
MWLTRTLCEVLEEMRACYKTRNFCNMDGLIEEAQSMGNRMEARLEEMKEYDNLHKTIKELEKKKKTLQKETKEKKND